MSWRRIAIVAGILLVMVLVADGIRNADFVRAYFASTDHFVVHAANPHVLYEEDIGGLADEIAALLPGAVADVEAHYGMPFPAAARVFVCATKDCFNGLTGTNNRFIRAATPPRGVVISPDILEWRESVPAIIRHELSHLYLKQRLGLFQRPPPAWFDEGYAVWISGGAGAERVTAEEASAAIGQGHHFVPRSAPRWIGRDHAAQWGLTNHMYYRQAVLFIEYLEQLRPGGVDQFSQEIAVGRSFGPTFTQVFSADVETRWREFVASLTVVDVRS